VDRVKQDNYNHLGETEKHCLKALPKDSDLSAEIAAASSIETETAAVLANAKAYLSSIEQMCDAKMDELRDEIPAACDDWYDKRDAADKWVKVSEDQGWRGNI
jgi:hypothetical protein